MKMWTIADKDEERFLRQPTAPFDFSGSAIADRRRMIAQMRRAMGEANGVGLSANQIGRGERLFVAQVRDKFYAIFNPEITKFSGESAEVEEGCLSAPELFGRVKRPRAVTLEGWDIGGRKIKIKAWGLLARVFQHEVDHLNGILFLDKVQKVYTLAEKEK